MDCNTEQRLRAKLAYSSPRIRVASSMPKAGRPPSDVWACWGLVGDGAGGYKSRCHLCSHSEHEGRQYQLADNQGDVDATTLVDELRGAKHWKDRAEELWVAKFGKPVTKAKNRGKSSTGRPAEEMSRSTGPSAEPMAKRAKTNPPHDSEPSKDQALPIERNLLDDPLKDKECLKMWHDPRQEMDDEQLERVRSLLQHRVRARQPPPLRLLQEVRISVKYLLDRGMATNFNTVYADKSWRKWVDEHGSKDDAQKTSTTAKPITYDVFPSLRNLSIDERCNHARRLREELSQLIANDESVAE
ncbi:hypothetical protein Ptr902_04163 [Pyrenophora tritici-repentis]|nr:hypothetical protein Ptr902_04163 [Pyrenophora tritici-repentis]